MRLIDKDKLKVKAEHIIGINGSSDAWHILSEIDNAEEIDAEPVRHGHWVFGNTLGHSWMKCSECLVSQNGQTATYTYCPNCGARMDGE